MMWISERKLLLEMPVLSEDEIFAQLPVASASTSNTVELEGDRLRTFVMGIISQTSIPQNSVPTERELGTIIIHHCTGKPLRKASLQTIPQVNLIPYYIATLSKRYVRDDDRSRT